MFFSVAVALSDRFKSITPLNIRRERFSEVFLLMRRLTEYQKKQNKDFKVVNGQRLNKVSASDDWF